MGDRAHAAVYSQLLAYLEARGHSLSAYGSAERGLSIVDARQFVDLLLANNVPLLGIELWRKQNRGHTVSGLEGWYCAHSDAHANHADALQYLSSLRLSADDLFTVQFA